MRKLALIGIILIVGSLFIVTASAQRDRLTETYAVGGELLPVSATSFLFSPWVLAVVMILITVLGGAITNGKISIERI